MTNTIDFTDVPTKTLVAVYNECAERLGSTPVNKFADRTTAEKRTRFILTQIDPAKRPAPFGPKSEPLPGGARALEALKAEKGVTTVEMKGSVRASDAPHPYIKSITSVSGPALETVDKTPTPALAAKTPRWQKPKRKEPEKVAYRPRPGTDQARMYELLTQPGGVDVFEFCAEMAQLTDKPTMSRPEQTWSNLGYLFVTLKGYGLDFDGRRFKLLVPKDERDSVRGRGQ